MPVSYPLHVVRSLGLELARYTRSSFHAIKDLEVVGSARRWEPNVEGLIVVAALHQASDSAFQAVSEFFTGLGLHQTSANVYQGHIDHRGYYIPVTVCAVSPLVWRHHCWWLTGSEYHRHYVKERALAKGYILQPNGLFRVWNQRVFVQSETEFYGALGLPHYPPEVRTNGQPPPLTLVSTAVCDSTRSENLDYAIGRAQARGIRELRVRHRYASKYLADSFVRHVNSIAPGVRDRVRLKAEVEVPVDVLGNTPPMPEGMYRIALALWYRPEYRANERVRSAVDEHHRSRVLLQSLKLSQETLALLVSRGLAFDIPCHPAAKYDEDSLRAAVKAGVSVTLSTDTKSPNHVGSMRYGLKRARRLRILQRQVL